MFTKGLIASIQERNPGTWQSAESTKTGCLVLFFGNANHKEWTLSLYNAVSRASYAEPEDIQITTIDDVIYMGMKNDVSFIISGMLNIYEQQSTYNHNMPIR